ncbi:MAG: hypothetical protein OXF02_01765 [Simkaniaceae bacterium]|nr:hypothetical protein [Simkaniaceae bacterium]
MSPPCSGTARARFAGAVLSSRGRALSEGVSGFFHDEDDRDERDTGEDGRACRIPY